jgi:hypothetical protein
MLSRRTCARVPLAGLPLITPTVLFAGPPLVTPTVLLAGPPLVTLLALLPLRTLLSRGPLCVATANKYG